MLPYPSDPDFPSALKARRELRGMSRADLARAANIHEVMPRRYEEPDCGEFARPRPESTWLALNRALGYDIPDNIDEFLAARTHVARHGLLGAPAKGEPDWESDNASTASFEPQGLLLKDATLEDIVKFLHTKNIEPTFRFPSRSA
jgi:hypothetical protein